MDGSFRTVVAGKAKQMLTYSIAIRTLGTASEKFREELISITRQTVPPERVLVYIAEGYPRPDFTVGREEYIWVKKGMVAQRALPYDEIYSHCILMLDDDVRLAPDSAERMLKAMAEYAADCVGADTFKNQNMSIVSKIYIAVTNLVFPHWSSKWAFKIHRNGSFSYNNNPRKSFYWSQSCAGPASMWRKSIYLKLHIKDELWLETLPFTYGEDMVTFYKLYKNGYKLGILYNSGCDHLNAGSSSNAFRKNITRIYTRTLASFVGWWRTIFQPSRPASAERLIAVSSFLVKTVWLFGVMCGLSLCRLTPRYVVSYVRGLIDGWRFVHTEKFKALRPYVLR